MKKLLIVIDMQNDFIDGALGTPEAEAIVEAVKDKIRSYPPKDVIATMDTHGPDYLSTQEGEFLPVVHCIKGTEGWQIQPEARTVQGEIQRVLKVLCGTDVKVDGEQLTIVKQSDIVAIVED